METIFVILTSIIILADATSTGDLRVPTTSGTLLGKESSLKGKKLRLFLGVPYAHPPTGLRRFKPPVEFTSPETVIETTRFSPSCLQPSHVKSVISPLLHPNRAEVNEDCLYLNIYVPDGNKSDPRLPVMVWLAGEGYDFADPQQYDLRFLALEGKAIVVSLNYRLSVFGFLTSLSDDAPGERWSFRSTFSTEMG
ncbi:carboxylesterase 4A [Caerostris extrusa]|uniref:Carboxylesterase 4A n=1 Tax=Caerostris extrusa TaxID=172846 RepID=A0AAV4QTD7_CAEEX|nr:carboxylesterase 4A [Caerostris extrusa]